MSTMWLNITLAKLKTHRIWHSRKVRPTNALFSCSILEVHDGGLIFCSKPYRQEKSSFVCKHGGWRSGNHSDETTVIKPLQQSHCKVTFFSYLHLLLFVSHKDSNNLVSLY